MRKKEAKRIRWQEEKGQEQGKERKKALVIGRFPLLICHFALRETERKRLIETLLRGASNDN
jgi:hypothetical protein